MLRSGCSPAEAWADAPQWRILETGFGVGAHFLRVWHAWRGDARRPRMLHVVSIDANPVARDALVQAAAGAGADIEALAGQLAAQWRGLLPGFHRLSFEEGRVLLTLCIGDVQAMLRTQRFDADSVYLDGDGALASPDTLKAVSRFARRGTRLFAATGARDMRDALTQCGFQIQPATDMPAGQQALTGIYDPAWTPRRRVPEAQPAVAGHCAVIGAGLAGAAVAASLARRGWQVTVLDAAAQSATGASGVPVAVMAPHVSPDDALLSRLTRAGIRMTRQQLAQWLVEGEDWRDSGVLERRAPDDLRVPSGWTANGPNDSWPASEAQRFAAMWPTGAAALWHASGAWVKPARLVQAWLAQPGITLRTGCHVARMQRAPDGWALHDGDGHCLLQADRVVLAAGFGSGPLAPGQPLQPVRGQVNWGRMDQAPTLPATPLNGDGHLIAQVPQSDGAIWLTGASFGRDQTDVRPNAQDSSDNLARLGRLHPQAAALLAPHFHGPSVQAWAGVRCASADRRPLVGPLIGPLDGIDDPGGAWLCSALGSRGLSFAVLCAELLAARWHAEPLPLPTRLAAALDTGRPRA
ncbi:FAD-dependent 5-carboxymethylaminomethyl-2-thiouridine(34) oxidoreductase MnmC [Variovorax ginsengisoli]|uniref:tRNA 5-methylaminomethyl-2-thiouridine biosynthesis bifunctional protein n=1 Tax=Variovorax ginsengisoli TaxID=363844 RepID=A0ABT9S372_9BURK|nr:FAD-dependent 5-carboxymethylaminomethyl-2-thiouridine(34) oxidoreductase MnmC [Variovorax ginsengisoli]MDP9898785.1 tRNA 5-methylaminomethyl-2-thiouridine biosynthesis bifunctional protein [Variovorax ginsengisoli]